jgi:hypothetical protein
VTTYEPAGAGKVTSFPAVEIGSITVGLAVVDGTDVVDVTLVLEEAWIVGVVGGGPLAA